MSKINKVSLTTLLILISSSANAQWAVVDVAAIAQAVQNYYMMFSQGQAIGGVKGAVDALRATEAVGIKQAADLAKNEIFDRRKSMGDFEIVKRDLVVMPTIEKCIEVTSVEVFVGPNSVSNNSSKKYSYNKTALKNKIERAKDISDVFAQTVLGRGNSCTQEDVNNGVPACRGGVGNYIDADRSASSLTQNIKHSEIKNKHRQGNTESGGAANYTIDSTQQDEAQRYILNTVTPKGPTINKELAKNNPQYFSIYNTIMGRLDTARDALFRMLSLHSAQDNISDTFKTFWEVEKPNYENIFPEFTWPAKPSEMEMINYYVRKNYVDALGDNKLSQEELLLKLNRQLALNNTIQMHNLNSLNDLIKVNSMILAQQITPATMTDLENAAKITRGSTANVTSK